MKMGCSWSEYRDGSSLLWRKVDVMTEKLVNG